MRTFSAATYGSTWLPNRPEDAVVVGQSVVGRSFRSHCDTAYVETTIRFPTFTWGISRTDDLADELFISQKTVKNHLASIYQKLDARDRTQAVLQAVRMGIVSLE